ncbi:MAG TPA: tetratricopeptide repeat protein [Ardenticatenaceae bacterium]
MVFIIDPLWRLYHWLLRRFDPNHPISLIIRAEEALSERKWGLAFDLSNASLQKRSDFAPAFFARGMARLHLDDYKGALHDLNRFLALTEEPQGLVYYWRGWIYATKGEWSLAQSDFDRALTFAPDEPELLYWRAYALWQRGEWQSMRATLDHLLEVSPDMALAWELRGHLLLHEDDFRGAEAAYTRAMQAGHESADLRYNRAVTRRHLERYAEAKADLQTILRANPGNPWAHIEMGHIAFAANNYQEALRCARSALSADPGLFEARINEVAALMALGRAAEAQAILEAMQADFPDEALVEQLYGDLLASTQESEAATNSYRRVLVAHPDNEMVRLKLAGELTELGRYDEALAEINRVLGDNPDCPDAYAARADVYRYTNQPDPMRADLDRLLALDPNNSWAYAFRAAHRQWTGDEQGAFADYGAALAADPNQAWIWAFRGQLHLRARRLQAARDDYQRAITLDPEDPWIRRQWADLMYHCGHPDRAAEVLDCLVEDYPEDGFARLYRADLFLEAGAWDEAREQLRAIVEMDHELGWLAHALLAIFASPEERQRHLALADEQRPEPSFWGITPAVVLSQRALVTWLRGDPAAATTLLREAMDRLEPGETPWLALRPAFSHLGATPLLALLEEAEPEHADSRQRE